MSFSFSIFSIQYLIARCDALYRPIGLYRALLANAGAGTRRAGYKKKCFKWDKIDRLATWANGGAGEGDVKIKYKGHIASRQWLAYGPMKLIPI